MGYLIVNGDEPWLTRFVPFQHSCSRDPPLPHTHKKIVVGCCWIFTINVYQMLKLIHSRPIWYLKGYSSPRLLFNTGSTETWYQQIFPNVNFE